MLQRVTMLPRVAMCCSVLHCAAVCCTVLQCVAVSFHIHVGQKKEISMKVELYSYEKEREREVTGSICAFVPERVKKGN